MGRRKVRNWPTTEDVQTMINEYFQNNRYIVLDYLVKQTGYTSMEEVRDACMNMRFGLDCGWVWLKTFNKEQKREWRLDNGGPYDAKVKFIVYPFNTQSITCKEIMLQKALDDLNLNDQYYTSCQLD